MSGFNGSGTFNISGVGLPYVSGTTISSSVANQLNTDLATGLSTCITKDGQSTVTANIGWNNFNINNLSALGIGTASPTGKMEVKSGSTTNFIIDSSGNVGIGTSSPTTQLQVGGYTGFSSLGDITGMNNPRSYYGLNSLYNGTNFISNSDGGNNGGSIIVGDVFGNMRFSTIPSTSSASAQTLSGANIATNERMRIDSSGNVGIGVTPGSTARRLVIYGATATSTGTSLALQTSTSGTAATDGFTMELSGTTAYLWNYENDAVLIGTNATERMRIDANGYALIGYTSSNGAYKLQVNSQIFATSSTIATSDGNYKENVKTLENALDLVCTLNPVSFDWKQHPVHNFDRSTTTTGFIAQEVQTALQNTAYVNAIVKTNTCVLEPEEKDADGNVTKPAVTEEFLGIAEGNLIAILTKAVQELKTELDTVKTELAALKGS